MELLRSEYFKKRHSNALDSILTYRESWHNTVYSLLNLSFLLLIGIVPCTRTCYTIFSEIWCKSFTILTSGQLYDILENWGEIAKRCEVDDNIYNKLHHLQYIIYNKSDPKRLYQIKLETQLPSKEYAN